MDIRYQIPFNRITMFLFVARLAASPACCTSPAGARRTGPTASAASSSPPAWSSGIQVLAYACVVTVCPRSLDQFYIVSYYMKWVNTSWTDSISVRTCIISRDAPDIRHIFISSICYDIRPKDIRYSAGYQT